MNNPICPCIIIKKLETEFAIITVYVDDLNLVGTPEKLIRTTNYLKNEFKMKNFGKTKFCLDLQIEHFLNEVLVHQSTYIKKVLKHFYMDKKHPLSSPMVVRSLDVKKNPFRPCEKNEELLGLAVPYLNDIVHLCILLILHVQTLFFNQFISKIQFCSNSKTLEWYQTCIALFS